MRGRVLIVAAALLAPLTLTNAHADELLVIFYNDLDIEGEMNAPWKDGDEAPDHLVSSNGQSTYLVRTIKAHLRYFLSRYETHGRDVRVRAVRSFGGITTPCAPRSGEASIVAAQNPDAVLVMGDNMECFVQELARRGVMSFGSLYDMPRSTYTAHPFMAWSFMPDQEEQAAASASLICRGLYADGSGTYGAGTGTFALDRQLQLSPRRFGLIYPVSSVGSISRGPQAQQHAELLIEQTGSMCGLEWTRGPGDDGGNLVRVYPESGSGTQELPRMMNEFQGKGITTVICYCVPVQNELTTTKLVAAARALNYHPEYFWDHSSRMDKPVWQRYYGPRMPEASFGVTKYWPMPALEDQEHYRAYLEQEPGTEPNVRFSFDIYWSMWTLFTAIERSGGTFTPAGVKAGLIGYEVRPDDPALASGGFTGENPQTFLDGSMAWWFEPMGEEPGADLPIGCNRSAGERIFHGAWPFGDEQLYADDASCWGSPHRAGTLP